MNALQKYQVKRALTQELTKTARLRMTDVEDELGMLLDKQYHPETRERIQDRHDNSFSLRHPYLTGIPTLGIAPAVAKENAVEHITRNLLRKHKRLRKEHRKLRDEMRARDLEDERLSIERARAEQPTRAIGAATSGALQLMQQRGMQQHPQHLGQAPQAPQPPPSLRHPYGS